MIPGGQGRKSQPLIAHTHEHPAKLRAGLRRRLGRRSGRIRRPLICEDDAPTPEAAHPPDLIVSRLGLGRHLAQLCDSPGQITSCPLRHSQRSSGTDAS